MFIKAIIPSLLILLFTRGAGAQGIKPAHCYTAEHKARSMGPIIYRKYKQINDQKGVAAADNWIRAGHSRFVMSNWGDKIIAVSIAQSTSTGNGGTASGGVEMKGKNAAQMNAYLKGKGGTPDAVREITVKAQDSAGLRGATEGKKAPPMLGRLKAAKPDHAASTLFGSAKALLCGATKGPSEKTYQRLSAISAFASRIQGEFKTVEVGSRAVVLRKEGPEGKLEVNYTPYNGISFRLEPKVATVGDQIRGWAVAISTQGSGNAGRGCVNVQSARLTDSPHDLYKRYIPSDKTGQGQPAPAGMLSDFGL